MADQKYGFGRRYQEPFPDALAPYDFTPAELQSGPNRAGQARRGERKPRDALLRIQDSAHFFTSPYLTCTECNSIAFIDAFVLERALLRRPPVPPAVLLDRAALPVAPSEDLAALRLEALPPCPGCGRTHAYAVGARDFSSLISSNKDALRLLRVKQRAAAIKLQAFRRGVLARRHAEVLREQRRREELRRFRAAAHIQSRVRGRLDRRAAAVERCLRLIKAVPAKVLREALVHRFGQQRVFWYKKQDELNILYANYRRVPPRVSWRCCSVCWRACARAGRWTPRRATVHGGRGARRWHCSYLANPPPPAPPLTGCLWRALATSRR